MMADFNSRTGTRQISVHMINCIVLCSLRFSHCLHTQVTCSWLDAHTDYVRQFGNMLLNCVKAPLFVLLTAGMQVTLPTITNFVMQLE